MARLRMIVVALAVLLVTGACSSGAPADAGGMPATLRVGLIPNISPDKQQALYAPFATYLENKLHVKVTLFVATDYSGVVSALVNKKIDLAYLGGLTYEQAAQQANVTPLVTEIDQETGTPKYLSAIVVKAGSPYKSVADLLAANARFAFGDPSSTSGSLYPRMMLTAAGARCSTQDLSSCPPLKSVTFTGAHDATAQAVLNGSVDAGGLELRILHRLEKQGTIPAGALRVIEQQLVMGYPWVAREGLSAATRAAITGAFTSITDPALLGLMRAKGYVVVTAGDYTEVHDQATALGLLTTQR